MWLCRLYPKFVFERGFHKAIDELDDEGRYLLAWGAFIQKSEIPQFSVTFENAAEVAMQKSDYYIEVAGELLTSKTRPFKKGEDDYQLPPFFNALKSMRNNNKKGEDETEPFSKFNRDYLKFLGFIENDWPFIRRLHELWLSDNHMFLAEQMRDKLPTDIFPLNNDLEYLRGIHQLFLMGFSSVLSKDFYDFTTKTIWRNITEVARINPNGYIALTEFFHENNLFKEYEERLLKILNSFIDKYPFFITSIGLERYTVAHDLNINGTTTVSFDDVKHFYLECFEAIGKIIAIVLAYSLL